jgi:hypothetical protein
VTIKILVSNFSPSFAGFTDLEFDCCRQVYKSEGEVTRFHEELLLS